MIKNFDLCEVLDTFMILVSTLGESHSPGASCWKVGSYLSKPGGLQCRILTNYYTPINYPLQYGPGLNKCRINNKSTSKFNDGKPTQSWMILSNF